MVDIPTLLTPRKPFKLPEKFIYQNCHGYTKDNPDIFKVFSTKNKNGIGILRCYPRKIYDKNDNQINALYIDLLFSLPPRKGLGSCLINFAKQYSKQTGCGGYLAVQVSSIYTPHMVPHIFYRKQGFTTCIPRTDRALDRYIAKNKQATYMDFEDRYMFYLPDENEQLTQVSVQKPSEKFSDKFLKSIKKLFKI